MGSVMEPNRSPSGPRVRIPATARRPLAGLALALLAPAGARAQDPPAARVNSVFSAYDHTNTPGCALGVTRGGHLVYERGYGMANLEYGVPITPRSPFHVASITKQFTAMSIVLLAREGRLSLDDDIRKYVPEVPDFGVPITLRELLHHTSGIRDQWELLDWAGWRDDDPITTKDILDITARQKALNFPPGDQYLYSNTGFTLLAEVVRRVSGQSLRDFTAKHIFTPLGMRDTQVHDDHTALIPGRTSAYVLRDGGGYAVSIPVFDNAGATSLFTTVEDLARWDEDAYTHVVGGEDGWAMMRQRFVLNDGDTIPYALALLHGRYRGLATIGHDGADAGYRASLLRFPAQHASVIVLCNYGPSDPGALAHRVADLYLARDFTEPPPPRAATGAPPSVPARDAARFAGTYESAVTNGVLRVEPRDGGLVVARGPYVLPLTPLGEGRFRVALLGQQVRFVAAPGQPASSLEQGGGRHPAVYRRVRPATPSAATLAGLAGLYASEELDAEYRIAVAGDSLVLRRRKADDATLRPVDDTTFTAGLRTIHFERDGAGHVTGLRMSGTRVRRVRFRRER